MSGFIKSILIKITGYGWIVVLAGLGLLGMAIYSQVKASGGSAYTAQDKLTTISGVVTQATEVTVTSKRRRGSSRVSDRYYQIDVKPESGEAQKLRISLAVDKQKIADTIEEKITAQYDADDDNIVYAIAQGAQKVLTYDETKNRMQASAERAAAETGSFGNIIGCIALMLVGGLAVFANRKLKASVTA